MSASAATGSAAAGRSSAGAASAPLIVARGLGKRFGDRLVLSHLDFELARDGFLLLTGPNGAGKTTLLRLLAGLAAPSEGELTVAVTRERIGYLAHDPLVYRELSAGENLHLFERLYGVPQARSRELLERFGLASLADQRVSGYSRGMKQRLALCRVLLHDPALLLLDEPFSSLDSESAELLDRELAGERGRRAVVVATHEPERVRPLATTFVELP